jgi:hypothetical protein
MNKLFFSALAAAFLDVNSGLGQTIITSVPYVISHSGTYVLGSSLAYLPANGAAIIISASDVILTWEAITSPILALQAQT